MVPAAPQRIPLQAAPLQPPDATSPPMELASERPPSGPTSHAATPIQRERVLAQHLTVPAVRHGIHSEDSTEAPAPRDRTPRAVLAHAPTPRGIPRSSPDALRPSPH